MFRVLFLVTGILLPRSAFAIGQYFQCGGFWEYMGVCQIAGLPPGESVGILVGAIVQSIFNVIALVSFIAIAWGGIIYISSRGENDRMENAKKTIMWAVLGFILAVVGGQLIQFIQDVFYQI